MKTCNTCGEAKPVEKFSRHGSSPDGLRGYCKACSVKRMQDYKRRNPDWQRDYTLKRNYGITIEDFRAMRQRQGYRCAICGRHEDAIKPKGLRVDHDHATGKVRGLLCHGCNLSLGHFGDSPEILIRASQYLEGEYNRKCHV